MNSNTPKKPSSIYSKKRRPSPGQPPDKAQRMAVYSLLCGIVGILCVCCFPSGVPCGFLGIALAFISRDSSQAEKKKFLPNALYGLVLSCVAIFLSFVVCYGIMTYYAILAEPELYPGVGAFVVYLSQIVDQILNSH